MTKHLSSAAAIAGTVLVGRAQPLTARTPGSVRALARLQRRPPWAPAPRVESELFEICIFAFEVNTDC